MNGFLKWFFVFMSAMLTGFGQIFKGLWNGIKQIFNIKNYIKIFKTYSADFGVLGWVLSVLAIIVVAAIFVLIIFMIVLAVRKYIRFRHSIVSNEDLIEEISDLQRQVVKMTKEKDEIMAMKVAQLGVYDNTALAEGEAQLAEGEQMPAQGEVQTTVDGVVQTADCRFSKLIEVDNFYKTYEPPVYDNDITLSGICEAYRNFACSRMHLYYDIKTIRLFIAGMASTKLIILQGISGTGKTSLPYSFGKFLQKDTTIASVQPSWRDRTELFGYFNEFTKNFNETEVLKRIYSSDYNDDVNFILLDEMNIARVEYYFAEMLSILEMPDPAEWELDLVPNVWSTDPVRLDLWVIEKLRVAFGNRILKQMNLFVPVYVACGGEELDGIDYVLATKIFRKFESLNLAMLRDELKELCTYMQKLFGRNTMKESIAYLERLQKLY